MLFRAVFLATLAVGWAEAAASSATGAGSRAQDASSRILLQLDEEAPADCGAEGKACCTNQSFDSGEDMCPGATAAQPLVCSALEDYETTANPATCVACGKADQPCCIDDYGFADRVCSSGFACTASGCVPCGTLGEACCTNTKFDSGAEMCPGASGNHTLVCSALEDYETEASPPTCVECGKEGEACCIGDSSFFDPLCAEDGLGCFEGTCGACGAAGQPCCADSACLKGSQCTDEGMCVACGGYGQPCCFRTDYLPDASETMCPYAGEAMCLGSEEEGFACTRCGAPGEHCCTGDERGRITPPGGDPELWQCWNGADCSADRMCPTTPEIPTSTDEQRQACLADPNPDEPFTDADTGAHFAACVGAALNTDCSSTRLHAADGDPIVPDRCLNRTDNFERAAFECPSGSSTASRNVYCSISQRKRECEASQFCSTGAMSCGEWSATSPLWDGTVTLAPGEADLWYVFSDDLAPRMATALACDGSLQVLTSSICRPGYGGGIYAIAIDGVLQTTLLYSFDTVLTVPLEATHHSGTMVVWKAVDPSASEDIGVVVYQQDTEGIVCSSNAGTSYSGTRYQTFANCQLMEEGAAPVTTPGGGPGTDAPPSVTSGGGNSTEVATAEAAAEGGAASSPTAAAPATGAATPHSPPLSRIYTWGIAAVLTCVAVVMV